MNTYSHTLVGAVLIKPIEKWQKNRPNAIPPLHKIGFLVGSFVPDLLLTLIGVFTVARDLAVGAFRDMDFEPGSGPPPPEMLERSMTMRLFDVWFFENPWVIAAQNLFHSPLLVTIFIVVAFYAWRNGKKWGIWFFWLSVGAMLHTLADIPLHVTDGPLLLFPLNWTWRYEAPISYWDPDYFGREWSRFEHTVDAILVLYLIFTYRNSIRTWFKNRRNKRKSKLATPQIS